MAEGKRIEELSAAIRYHRELYYNHSAPEISDTEFDALWDELKSLDPDNLILHEVGPEPLPGTVKVEHKFPMRSLDKGTTNDDIIHFIKQTTFGGKRYLAQPKLDGSALSLEYVEGNLFRAATRGSGERGEDVTLNAKLIENIPKRLNLAIDCHVRGEVVMPLSVFDKKYKHISPNPRNLCSGALRQKHGEGKAQAEDLIFQAYDVKFPNKSPEFENDSELLEWLTSAGINPAPWTVFNSETLEKDMIEYTHLWSEKRSKYEYEIDGIVFKLDNLNQRELLGMTAHHPRWALAWKFPSQEAKSVLLDVDWQTGRTGVVTPVGRIAPQMVGGVTVENVTLHNVGELQRLGIRIGDKVRITRRGDVIPKIIENLGQAKNEDLQNRIHADGTLFTGTLVHRDIQVPVVCPSCPRELITDGAFLRCTALDCGARTARSLTYWCRSLEMDGIGEKLIQSLLESRLIETIADLYKLNRVQISSLERMGEKSANNVIKELDKTRKLTLSKFLHALGMERIGPEVAIVISQHFTNLESLLNWAKLGDNSELTNIDGIGDKVAEILRNGLNKRTELIRELSQIIEIIDEEVQKVGIFEGKTFCITGSLSKPRKEITLAIKNVGGKVVSSVSSKLNYLVAGESAGSKLKKAIELDITIINEIELFRLITDNQTEFQQEKKTLFDYE